MKNQPKKLKSPEPPSGRSGYVLPQLLRLAGFTLGLILLLALFHLLTLGIPGSITRRITARLQDRGIPVHIESITLSLHRGWVLHDVQLFSPLPDDLDPVLQAEKMYVHAWPHHWTSFPTTGWNLSLSAKDMNVSLGEHWENTLDENHPFKTIERMQVHLYADPGYIAIDHSEFLWGGYIFRTSGQANLPKQKTPSDLSAYSDIQMYAARAANMLAGLKFDTPPEINFQFRVFADQPEMSELNITLFASGLRHHGRLYHQIGGALSVQNGRLTIDSVQITCKDSGRLIASGTMGLEDRIAQIHIQNSLQSPDLIGLMPAHVATDLARAEIDPFGAAEFDADLGPAPIDRLGETIRMDIEDFQVKRKDLTFDPLQLKLVKNGSQLKMSDIRARANGRQMGGSFQIDLNTLAWSTRLQGAVMPYPIGTLTGGGLKIFIDRFDFPNNPPDIQVKISHDGTAGSLRLDGTISGRDFLCAGMPLTFCKTTMAYSNSVLILNGLSAVRGETNFNGNIEIDFGKELAQFDAISEFPPHQIAQALAPGYHTILNDFTFAGPIYSEGRGQVDYSGGTNHHFEGIFEAEDISFAGLKTEWFHSDVRGKGAQLIFSNTAMEFFDGVAEGGGTFDLQFNDEAEPYRLDIDATELNLAKIFQHFEADGYSQAKGTLSATMDFAADAKKGFWASAKGRGEVEIDKGQLKDLPILGGFAKLIRTTLPGFSLFSLTTFYSKYELSGDGWLHSQDVQMGGTLFSARAHGKYSPEKGLDFTVRTEPLRQTRENKKWYQIHLWTADAIKQGTSPLFNLLEFRLEGTLEKPTWRMKALPKETYELLGKLKPSSVE